LMQIDSALHHFVSSFTTDYNNVGSSFENKDSGKVLNVWIGRGRSWAEVMKQMADEDFTRKTGIKVNLNTFPTGDTHLLLLSSASGSTPDVALGVPNNTPVDYAVRGALYDMRSFPDYDEVIKRFRPGALIPFAYNSGAYAIPETQDFNIMYYRKDILESLGVSVPQTWNDVYDLLPLLQRKGMSFGYPFSQSSGADQNFEMNGFSTFLFQRNGDFYKDNGKRSGLASPEAMTAFKDWTRLYSSFRVPQEINFYNRFRIGDIPIGVSNFGTYMMLSTAAPELNGLWGIAEVPGTKQTDGSIDHTAGGGSESAVIFKDSTQKEESWEFLKWWTSTDVQVRYGREMEAVLGADALWNTSNIEAMQKLPWPKDDLNALMKQWKSYKDPAVVPGGYYTSRYIVNAWNETVLQGKNPREALEDAAKEIDKELAKKREEFGLPN
jgi:ABC-type glycerol-3-phosphate transport system substrate-binding protein